jgi:ubiquinone/menaquinone biosynthesis C-methylase UbiE
MGEINLLKALPTSKRDVKLRTLVKTNEHIEIARQYGHLYFDGPREYGYGGYAYDGRWRPVAKDIVEHFKLKPGDRLLDVGCAKGFLVKDLLELGIDAYGVDISEYAIFNCEPEVIGRLHIGSAEKLIFPNNSFKAVVSINTIHNLPRLGCITALQEIERIAPGKGFIQVDSYHSPAQKEVFENWVLTAKYHGYPDEWRKLFNQACYTGDYYWTVIN